MRENERIETTEILGVQAEEISEDSYVIRLINGKDIHVKTNVIYKDKTGNLGGAFPYQVEDQYFSNFQHASSYLKSLIQEKISGVRYILHSKKNPPEICGVDGSACRAPGECNRALCSACPVAEAFFAKQDGVTLVYAIRSSTIERKEDIFKKFCECLPGISGDKIRSDGDMIYCRDQEAAEILADLLEVYYRKTGKTVTVVTGYYDPKEDKRNEEVDEVSGWYYVSIE